MIDLRGVSSFSPLVLPFWFRFVGINSRLCFVSSFSSPKLMPFGHGNRTCPHSPRIIYGRVNILHLIVEEITRMPFGFWYFPTPSRDKVRSEYAYFLFSGFIAICPLFCSEIPLKRLGTPLCSARHCGNKLQILLFILLIDDSNLSFYIYLKNIGFLLS